MIHHPSFYGLTTSRPVISPRKLAKQPEIKTIIFDDHVLKTVIKSSDTSMNNWKISVKEIFREFSFNIDYQKFVQWCQNNSLLSLVKLDEEETRIMNSYNNDDDNVNDYYVDRNNLDRCMELLNDLKRGSISMTLLPSSQNSETRQQQTDKSPLAGICCNSNMKIFLLTT